MPPPLLFLSTAMSISEVLQEHSSIFGIRLCILILSVIFTLFLILTVLCLCLPSFRFPLNRKTYESCFQLSKPFASKADFRHGKETMPSFGRRLLSFNASEVEMDFSSVKEGVELEALWSAHKPSLCQPSLTGDVEAFGVHLPASNMGNIRYTVKEIEVATNGFDRGNLIGRGETGAVYQGVLLDGARVAVKRLVSDSYYGGDDHEELELELDAITKITHKNLVKLLGYCREGDPHRVLIYEYIDNGSLHHWLHVHDGESSPLTWDRRMSIIRGTSKGLAYLHEELNPGIFHGGIKSSNIALDQQWNPKITDIGSATLLDSRWSPRSPLLPSSRTQEMAIAETASKKTDVYCFGILIMEIVTGRPPVDETQPEAYLIDWVKYMISNQEAAYLPDPRIPEMPTLKDLKWILLMALMCVDPDLSQRPKIGHVARMLETQTLVHALVVR